jgi:predicted ATP-dependent endonuclease of OLD family
MPFLKRFTIKGFRSYQNDIETLDFGIPHAGRTGSGITYIVGANNSGKTTLVDALTIRDNSKIRSSEKNGNGPEFVLMDLTDTIKRKAILIRPESNTIKEDPRLPVEELFEVISSRRHWASYAGSNLGTEQLLAQTTSIRENQNVETANLLKNIEREKDKYEAFVKLTQRIIPEFSKFAVGFEDQEFIEYISKANIKHKSDFLGDGVISIIRILVHLFVGSTKPIIIDEPELSLHPLAQKRLTQLIGEFSMERQIVISTHSPYFLDWEFIKNGAKVNRIVKIDDQKSKIYTLGDYKTYESLIKGANWQQPYLFDTTAKEIFFQENILFLEGQEDVGLLKDFFTSRDINIFGYGSRGYTTFDIALQFAKDIGIQKAAVILDAPKDPAKTPNENNVKEALEKKYPKYKILQWNKNDIRDKESHTSEVKEGYFTKNGKLKEAAQLDDFHQRVQEIKDFFS